MEIKKILAGLLVSAVTVGMLAVPAFADFETVEKASAGEVFEEVTAASVLANDMSISSQEEFETALNNLSDGDVLNLSTGSYTIPETLTKITASITIAGEGKNQTTLKVSKPITVSTGSFSLKNLVLDGSVIRAFNNDKVIAFSGKDAKFENVDFLGGGQNTYGANISISLNEENGNADFYGCKFSGAFRGIQIWTMNNSLVIFDNCVFAPQCYTLNVDGRQPGGKLIVKNSVLSGWTSFAEIEKAVFENATFEKADSGYGYNFVKPYADTVFEDCDFNFAADDDTAKIEMVHSDDVLMISNSRLNSEPVDDTNMSELLSTDSAVSASQIVSPVAKIGTDYFTSLVDAVAAALVSGENETVTLLCNANGDGIIIPAGANITIDFGGYSYTIDGTLVGSNDSETNGFQLLKDANVTLKNGTIISSKLAKWGPNTKNDANATGANIVIQNYSNLRLENITIDGDQSAVTEGNPSAAYARYVLSNNNGNTVLTGNTNIIAAPGNYAFDVYGGWYPAYPSVTVTLDENMTGTITGKIQVSNREVAEPDNFKLSIKNGTIDGTIQDDRSKAQKEAYPKLNAISGGSFTTDVSDYCEEGFAPRFVNGKYVVGEDNSATTIKLIFKQPDANDNTLYNIVLAGVEKNINRLNAAEFKFALNTTDAITYEIAAADGLALIPQADGKYEFHFDGKDFTGDITDTGAEIVIGTVKFEGYGKFTFFAETGRATATTTEDNLVTEFVVDGTDGKGTLVIGEDENKIEGEIKVPKQTLTINIAMNHPVTDNVSAYQDMKVVISGGDLAGETLTFNLGTEDGAYALNANGAYNFGVELTQNRLYTVTVSGAGYRTARYTVAMTEDKTMNFWNNVMSNEITVVDDVKDTVNFLAGDIVKDGKINIYDLSAVVAYFGTENNQAEYSKFAKYDLNRDGKIDMMDISIVLTSWGK